MRRLPPRLFQVLSVGDEAPAGGAGGRVVLFSKWSGQEVEVAGKKAVFVKHADLLGLVE